MSTRLLICLALLFPSCTAQRDPETKPTSPPTPSPSVPASPGAPLVTLERTVCNGSCPVYRLAVYADGSVEYYGEFHVKLQGPHTAKLSPEKLSALTAAFEKADYFHLADSYEHYGATCMPTVITSYGDDKRSKTITHYHGDFTAPEALTRLEDEIDRIVGTEAFIGSDAERITRWGDVTIEELTQLKEEIDRIATDVSTEQ